MRSSPQAGIHLTLRIASSAFCAQIVALHADEPLLGGAEDRRLVAAPAVRIAVLDLSLRQQRARSLQHLDDDRVRLPNRLADQLFGQPAVGAFGVEEPARGIHRTVGR